MGFPDGFTITELSASMAQRRVNSEDLTTEVLRRAQQHARLGFFIELFPQIALHAARTADQATAESSAEVDRSPLHGMPFGFKDIFRTPWRSPKGGSAFHDMVPEGEFSPVINRLIELGAVPIGALNLDEICYGMTGLNAHFGAVRNPWNPAHIAGGSSSGAAAAVACASVPFAIGSDTAGSIRIPAAFCGVTGFKPSLGRLSTCGAVSLSTTQDCIGLVTRNAADCALLMAALTDSPLPGLSGMKAARAGGTTIRVPSASFLSQAEQSVRQAFENAMAMFRSLGHVVDEKDLLPMTEFERQASILTGFEVVRYHRQRIDRCFDRFGGPTQRRLATAALIDADQYQAAVDAHRRRLSRPSEIFDGADLIACPTVLEPPPTIEAVSDAQASVRFTLRAMTCVRPFSYLGLPAISIPMGFSPEGLPLGLQLIGRQGDDDAVLQAARAFQAVTDWHRSRSE